MKELVDAIVLEVGYWQWLHNRVPSFMALEIPCNRVTFRLDMLATLTGQDPWRWFGPVGANLLIAHLRRYTKIERMYRLQKYRERQLT